MWIEVNQNTVDILGCSKFFLNNSSYHRFPKLSTERQTLLKLLYRASFRLVSSLKRNEGWSRYVNLGKLFSRTNYSPSLTGSGAILLRHFSIDGLTANHYDMLRSQLWGTMGKSRNLRGTGQTTLIRNL